MQNISGGGFWSAVAPRTWVTLARWGSVSSGGCRHLGNGVLAEPCGRPEHVLGPAQQPQPQDVASHERIAPSPRPSASHVSISPTPHGTPHADRCSAARHVALHNQQPHAEKIIGCTQLRIATHLRDSKRHLLYGIIQCYLPPDTGKLIPP